MKDKGYKRHLGNTVQKDNQEKKEREVTGRVARKCKKNRGAEGHRREVPQSPHDTVMGQKKKKENSQKSRLWRRKDLSLRWKRKLKRKRRTKELKQSPEHAQKVQIPWMRLDCKKRKQQSCLLGD